MSSRPNPTLTPLIGGGDYPSVRPLVDVVDCPVLRMDGSVLQNHGYDPSSRLYYAPGCEFPAISENSTWEDAREAVNEVFDLVVDFPFKSVGHDKGDGYRAAWLAGLLTPLARHAIDGPCPIFLVDANVPGAGKSKLCQMIAVIATGREVGPMAFTESEDEMRKRAMAVARAGERIVLIDNVRAGARFGSAALDGLLTGRSVSGRMLGTNEMGEYMHNTIWYATGNNLETKGDLVRRSVPLRLESPHENPEIRDE